VTQPAEPKEDLVEMMTRWRLIAMVFGFNELASRAEKLGEKVFFRMARNDTQEVLGKDHQVKFTGQNPVILELPDGGPPSLTFVESDIELMREAVRQYDERKRASAPEPEKTE
jgi:hypothetical protein